MQVTASAFLSQLVYELVKKHRCHTVILYGSHARGDATEHSDYDLMGVRKSGKKMRIAEKRDGKYIDVFLFSDKDLQNIGEPHLYMHGGKVLLERGTFGTNFLRRLKTVARKKYKPLPPDDIQVRRVWLHKMFDRVVRGDIEGNYRRAWLHEALLCEYFHIRKKRYLGSKQSFAWLKQHDSQTYQLFDRVLADPMNLKVLRQLVEKVSMKKSGKK